MSLTSRPLKVAVLCSGRAPGLLHALNRDPRRGPAYRIVCCITSHDTFAEEVRVERRGIPCIPHPIDAFAREHGTSVADLALRQEYDRKTVGLLEAYHPDVVILDRYRLLLTRPMLQAFEGRIVDVHPADLLRRTPEGAAAFTGIHAVRDALATGERETRASAHVVTDRLDDGPVLLRSWPFPVSPVVEWARAHEAHDLLRATAWIQQEWMLRDAWGAMLVRTIELAGIALEQPGRPLRPERAGRWALAPDGSFTPDGALLEVL